MLSVSDGALTKGVGVGEGQVACYHIRLKFEEAGFSLVGCSTADGDVIALMVADGSDYDARTVFNHETCTLGHHYVKSVAYHQEIVSQLKSVRVNKVQLVGSFEHREHHMHRKSKEYLTLLHNFYESHGVEVGFL